MVRSPTTATRRARPLCPHPIRAGSSSPTPAPRATALRTVLAAAWVRTRRPMAAPAATTSSRPWATSRSRSRSGTRCSRSHPSSTKLSATNSSSRHMPFTVPNTRTRSPQRRLQQGQAIILIALLILVLFGMLGLAIDSGRGYVDRRDQQAAVDAAALAAGDWYENYTDLNLSITNAIGLYQRDLRLYNGYASVNHTFALVGSNNSLPQDTYTYTYNEGYTLTIVATNTQFNGYQFRFTTTHSLPLAFMQIFGGGLTPPIGATATAVVGNQRQTPALLTLSTQKCSMN